MLLLDLTEAFPIVRCDPEEAGYGMRIVRIDDEPHGRISTVSDKTQVV